MTAAPITYHRTGTAYCIKNFFQYIGCLRNFIANDRNDGLIFIYFNSAKWFKLFYDLLSRFASVSIVTETATSEVVIISIDVRYFSNTSKIFLKKPYASNMRLLFILIAMIPSFAATAFTPVLSASSLNECALCIRLHCIEQFHRNIKIVVPAIYMPDAKFLRRNKQALQLHQNSTAQSELFFLQCADHCCACHQYLSIFHIQLH